MALMQNLLVAFNLAPGAEKRLGSYLSVEKYDRLHFHISNASQSVANIHVQILFGTQVGAVVLLASNTIWFEGDAKEHIFEFKAPATYNRTGFVMSVPVIAPLLYDVILTNTGPAAMTRLHVSVMSQDI